MATKKKKTDANPQTGGQQRNISENRKARFKYEILEQIECGIVLVGSEVKSLRENKISLDEAYVKVRGQEIWLIGADIAEYRQATIWNHDRRRPRKLLVHKRQLQKLSAKAQEKGFTLVPLHIFFNERGIVKLMVGVGKGKKTHDKRQTIKSAEAKRSIARAMKTKR
jgi:SsrA-binding protein